MATYTIDFGSTVGFCPTSALSGINGNNNGCYFPVVTASIGNMAVEASGAAGSDDSVVLTGLTGSLKIASVVSGFSDWAPTTSDARVDNTVAQISFKTLTGLNFLCVQGDGLTGFRVYPGDYITNFVVSSASASLVTAPTYPFYIGTSMASSPWENIIGLAPTPVFTGSSVQVSGTVPNITTSGGTEPSAASINLPGLFTDNNTYMRYVPVSGGVLPSARKGSSTVSAPVSGANWLVFLFIDGNGELCGCSISVSIDSAGAISAVSAVNLWYYSHAWYFLQDTDSGHTSSAFALGTGIISGQTLKKFPDDPGISSDPGNLSNPSGSRNPWQDNSNNPGIIGGDGTHEPFAYNLGSNENRISLTGLANIVGGALNTGVHIYRLTASQLNALCDVFWVDNAIEQIKQIFAGNIENCVLSIYATQFLSENSEGTAAKEIYLGSYATGVSGVRSRQFRYIDPVTISLPEFYGTVDDYTNTTLVIYLPYVGYRQIDPQKYIGGGIKLVRILDFLSGTIAYILYGASASGINSDGDWEMNNTMPMDIFTASFKNDIPIGGQQYSNLISGILQYINGAASAISSGAGFAAGTGEGAAYGIGALVGGLSSMATGYIAARTPTYSSIGGIGAGMGGITPFKIFCLVFRKIAVSPGDKLHLLGAPAHTTVDRLGLLSGFVKCDNAVLGGAIPLDYKEDILQQLRNGVYI